MSGGVDSSVAAAMLVEQGYEVVGVTMKLWRGEDDPFAAHRFGGCCTIGDSQDARSVAAQLGIPYYVMDLQQEFEQAVVDDFVREYSLGRTPNPCARCNEFIKFRAFLDRADELDCDLIATGHYAQIERRGEYFH
jgi:tRNA-specific 2-thiouridylase